MTDITETIPQYLARMREKDMGKNGPESLGWRTTREVADFMGMSRTAAILQLDELADTGEVIAAKDGSTYIWRAPGPGDITPSLPAAVGAYLAAIDEPTVRDIEQPKRRAEALAALRLAYAQIIPEQPTGEQP